MTHAWPPTSAFVPLALVTRSGWPESWHFGAAVVVASDGRQWQFGDGALPVYARSAVKPMQALPLLERDAVARFGLDARELALISASHVGTTAHVAVAAELLAKFGFGVDDLQCGPHAPFDAAAARALAQVGQRPSRLHNNCSGKHAGFLALARECGVASARYLDPDSASQREVRAAVSAMAGLVPEQVEVGADGCGAPTLRLPLVGLARAFCALANPAGLPAARARGCRALLAAVSQEPAFLQGDGKLCTELVRAAPGSLYPKNGAEGVFAVGVVGRSGPGYGIAVKVADGEARACAPVVVDLLRRVGVWTEVPQVLAAFARPPVLDTRKQHVGDVESALPPGL